MEDFEERLISDNSLQKYFDFNEALKEFHNLFNTETVDERAIAIIGGTFVEMALEQMLYAFFPDDDKDVNRLFDFNSPLGTFSNKISMTYCLGLIDEIIKNDITYVRKVRNKFAHILSVKFDDNQIKSWVRKLEFHKISMMMDAPENATDIEIFQVGVNQIISHLHGLIGAARFQKRIIKRELKNFK